VIALTALAVPTCAIRFAVRASDEVENSPFEVSTIHVFRLFGRGQHQSSPGVEGLLRADHGLQRFGDALGLLHVTDEQRRAAPPQKAAHVGEGRCVGVAGGVDGMSGHEETLAEARTGRIDCAGGFGPLAVAPLNGGPAGWPMHHPPDTLE